MKNGWQPKPLGEVCQLMTGGTPDKTKPEYFGGEIKWLVSGDIHQGEIYECEGRITDLGLQNSNAKFLPLNSVMIALNGQGKTRGTVALLRTKATCNQSLVSICPNDPNELLPEFLYANLHGRYDEIRKMTGDSGNDRRGLNMPLLRQITIPVAPPSEQKRIVGILAKALAAIAAAKANAEKNLLNARALFDSYIQSIFTQPEKSWAPTSLGAVCEFENGDRGKNYPNKSEYVESGIPWINTGHIQRDGTLSSHEMNFISRKKYESLRSGKIQPGDLVYCLRGATLGKTALVEPFTEGAVASSLVIIRPRVGLERRFLYFFLTSPLGQLLIKGYENGAAQPNLGAKSVAKFPILLPPLFEQERIVTKIDNFRKETQHLVNIYEQKRFALEKQTKSLLHQAFSGAL